MILRTNLALIALACPAGAEVPLLSMEFPAEAFILAPDEDFAAESVLDLNGEAAIAIKLGQSAAESFGAFTARHVGEEAVIRICSVEVSRPVLLSTIEGGSFIVSGSAAADLDHWLDILNTRTCDPSPGS